MLVEKEKKDKERIRIELQELLSRETRRREDLEKEGVTTRDQLREEMCKYRLEANDNEMQAKHLKSELRERTTALDSLGKDLQDLRSRYANVMDERD